MNETESTDTAPIWGSRDPMIVSHNAFKGTRGFFEAWREALHGALHPTIKGPSSTARRAGVYDDQTVPINVLMYANDDMQPIPVDMCGPLADALAQLIPNLNPHMPYMRVVTDNFVNGLRDAADETEPLTFNHS